MGVSDTTEKDWEEHYKTLQRRNVKDEITDFLSENIMPLLRNIDDLAEQQHLKLCECVDIDEQKREDVMGNLSIIRENVEVIKELIGVYR